MPIKLLSSFSRMRRFQPYSAVVAALRDSALLQVQGAEGEETVKRVTPYTMTTRKMVDDATVYVKGFGDERDGTQAELEEFFAPYEGVLAVRLRRARSSTLLSHRTCSCRSRRNISARSCWIIFGACFRPKAAC